MFSASRTRDNNSHTMDVVEERPKRAEMIVNKLLITKQTLSVVPVFPRIVNQKINIDTLKIVCLVVILLNARDDYFFDVNFNYFL